MAANFGVALEGPFAVDLVDESGDLAQARVHLGAQRAQVRGRRFCVAADALRIREDPVHASSGSRAPRRGWRSPASTACCVPSTTPPSPNTALVRLRRPRRRAARHAAERSEQRVGAVDRRDHLASRRPRCRAPRRARRACRHALGDACAGWRGSPAGCPPSPVICSMFSSTLRSVATMRGISSACRRAARALGAVAKRRVLQVAGERADARAADDAALEREDARLRSHFASLRGTSISMRAGRRRRSAMRLHAPDREAGEREVHSEAHALGVVGYERQALRGFEHAARVQRVDHEAARPP